MVIGCRRTVLFGNDSPTGRAAPLVSRSFEEGALLVGNTFSSLVPLRHSNVAFYLLTARAWELLLGALLAISVSRLALKSWQAQVISATGLLLILAAILGYRPAISFPGAFALIPCLGMTVMILVNAQHSTLVSKCLSTSVLVRIGLVSYSLYLWHWPLFVYANYLALGQLPTGLAVALTSLSLILAFFSWRFIETPFRSQQRPPNRRAVFGYGSAAILLLLDIGFGLRGRFSPQALQFANARTNRNPPRKQHHDLTLTQLRMTLIPIAGPAESPPTLMILADSHGDALMPVLCPCVNVIRSQTLRSLGLPHHRFVSLISEKCGRIGILQSRRGPTQNQPVLAIRVANRSLDRVPHDAIEQDCFGSDS